MNEVHPESEWENLIQKHLDGQTCETEATALSDQIVDNAEIRSAYLKAVRIHGALNDEMLSLSSEASPARLAEPNQSGVVRPSFWPKHLAAALMVGTFIGLLGAGVVWAVGTPKSEARGVLVADGDFEATTGPVPIGFPTSFAQWSGEPAEVIEQTDGNRQLRFLETANIKGHPNGGAGACNVFQLVDLSSLQKQWGGGNPEEQVTLQLSARFRREAAPTDTQLPKVVASCTIHLYEAAPESIGAGWPDVIREAVAVRTKVVVLQPGEESGTISASCLLAPEATIALISVNVNTRTGTRTPIELGGFFADDVQLTAIKQPALPVRFVDSDQQL